MRPDDAVGRSAERLLKRWSKHKEVRTSYELHSDDQVVSGGRNSLEGFLGSLSEAESSGNTSAKCVLAGVRVA